MFNPEEEKSLAIALFNRTWELLDKKDRSDVEDLEMIHTAHASRFHWRVGETMQHTIGEWQVSRVYSELGRGESAVFHAKCAERYCSDALPLWLQASVAEGLARAYHVAGDLPHAEACKTQAIDLLARVDDDADARVVQADIDSLPF